MNILIYIPDLDKNFGGVFQYSLMLLSILKKIPFKFIVYYSDNKEVTELASLSDNIILLSQKEKNEPVKIRIGRRFFLKVNEILKCLGVKRCIKVPYKHVFIDYIIEKYKIDIIHSPIQKYLLTSAEIPFITTMHDVQELHFPEFFSSGERASRAINYKYAIDMASAIIVSYEHIKNDIIRFFNANKSKIFVCLLDMQKLWFEKYYNRKILDLKQYNLPDQFILYPAATWKHKNHINLIKAIKIIKEKCNLSVNLICTGSKTDYYSELKKDIDRLGVSLQVSFLGIVTDHELFSIYKKAKAVVIPTLYEAGSFPLMESMFLKVPVICSNITSLPETIGNEQFTFNPDNPNEIATLIIKIINDQEYINSNLENCLQQISKLKNNNILQKMTEIYNTVLNNI